MKSSRVNLTIPLELAIDIEKLCEQRGIRRTTFMAEAIKEKLDKSKTISFEDFAEKNRKTLDVLDNKLDKILASIK